MRSDGATASVAVREARERMRRMAPEDRELPVVQLLPEPESHSQEDRFGLVMQVVAMAMESLWQVRLQL